MAVIGKSGRWAAVLTAGVVATVVSTLIPLFVPGYPGYGKGGPGPDPLLSEAPPVLFLVGLAGIVVGLFGITRARPAWRRLSVLSACSGGLAVLLLAPGPWVPWSPWVSLFYAGIWLGGLMGLIAIGAAIGTFVRPMRNKALEISLAVLGLLAGIPCALWALWILGLVIGPGAGD